ncbi:hypothetical protein KI387_039304, partial [Taxus chinensis]
SGSAIGLLGCQADGEGIDMDFRDGGCKLAFRDTCRSSSQWYSERFRTLTPDQ